MRNDASSSLVFELRGSFVLCLSECHGRERESERADAPFRYACM